MFGILASVSVGGLIALSAYFYMKLRRPPGFPPGPPAYPLLGSIPSLNIDFDSEDWGYQFQLELQRLADIHGPIYSLALDHSWKVIINDFSVMKEAFLKMGNDMAGRPFALDISKAWNPEYPSLGIIDGTYDEQLKLQRHTVIQVLKKLGYGGSITEDCIMEEVDIMIETFRSMGNKPFHISDHIGNAVANVTVHLLLGERYDYDNKEFKCLRHSVEMAFAATEKTLALIAIPGNQFLPSQKKNIKNLFDSFGYVLDYMQQKIAENQWNESIGEPRNFIEGYQMERQKNPMLENKLLQILMDFIQAGLETTSTTLGWAILFMVTYPEIQKKVQEEVDVVVGRNRKPKLADRSSLPYTTATTNEIRRLATTSPMTIPHATMKQCKLGGYVLPKDTEIWINLWSVLRNPDIWPDPLVFKPERFLDSDGKIQHHEEFIPFGLGRRSCLGEQLSKQELFVIFSNLLHRFTFTSPDGIKGPISRGVIAITHRAPEYRVQANYRD